MDFKSEMRVILIDLVNSCINSHEADKKRDYLKSTHTHYNKALSSLLALIEKRLMDKLPINPNSSHCSQCGRDFYSFNNGFNQCLSEIKKEMGI
jgi:recombinational DNA repair protein (RecF pathway)